MSQQCHDLTMCTVVFDRPEALDLSYSLTSHLNPNHGCEWVRVINQPSPGVSAGRFRDVPGVDRSAVPPNYERYGSYQHALGLSIGVKHVSTRYLLIVDPDVYVVRKNWIKDVMTYVQENELAFFGLPYHCKHLGKYRNFPSIWCMLIDTSVVDVEALDFRPSDDPVFSRFDGLMMRLLRTAGFDRRTRLGRDGDTGVGVYQAYHRARGIRYAVAQSSAAGCLKGIVAKTRPAVDRWYPTRYRYLPNPATYTLQAFPDHGLPGFGELGAEEYFWQGRPFAVHTRFSKYEDASNAAMVERVRQVVELSESGEEQFPFTDDVSCGRPPVASASS